MQLMEPTAKVVPNELLMRVVHGEQDMYFHQPIVPGMELVTRACPMGVYKAPSGVTVHTRLETNTADGEPVNDQWMVAFFRGADDELDEGERAPSHRIAAEPRSAEPVAVVAQHFDDDQTYRYAEASGDPMPIHTDEEFAATGAAGDHHPWALHDGHELRRGRLRLLRRRPRAPQRLAVRFSKPGLPGHDISTSIWRQGGSTPAPPETAIGRRLDHKDGLAEVAMDGDA